MKIVVLSFKIGPAARTPVRPPSARPPSACPPVRPSARAGAARTYIHKTPDRPPWAAVTRKPMMVFVQEKRPPYFWKPPTCGYVAAGVFFLLFSEKLPLDFWTRSWTRIRIRSRIFLGENH